MTVQLRAAVGNGQANHPEDVALVQLLLNGTEFGNLPVTTVLDGPTATSIEAFQRHHFGFTDGVLSPGDIGFLRLRGAAPTGAPVTNAQQDMVLRSMAVHFADGSNAGFGEVPLDLIRATADGLGMVGQWVVDGGATGIFSHPRFGTWEVKGAILVKYRELAEESSALGNPISGERSIPPGRVSWFERGNINFDAATGDVVVNTL